MGSIVPRRIRADDVLMRLVAAVYLRLRSSHFRKYSVEIEQSHNLAWAVRAAMAIGSLSYYYDSVSEKLLGTGAGALWQIFGQRVWPDREKAETLGKAARQKLEEDFGF